jgi:DnaJ family protein C protein 14
LENNISLPATGDEAMRRLLACKGKDPYRYYAVHVG